jgi:hypothetical protein
MVAQQAMIIEKMLTVNVIRVGIAKPTRTVPVSGKPQVHTIVSLAVPAGSDVGVHIGAGNVQLETHGRRAV